MKNIVAVAVAAVGLAAGAVGLASAGPADSSSTAATTTTVPGGARAARGPQGGRMGGLGRAVHGDLIVKGRDGGFEKVVLDRGTLTAADADSLTLHRPDGVDVTVKLDDQTRYRGVENAGALQKDKPVTVVSQDGTARVVMQRDPNGPRPRPGMRRRGGAPADAPEGAPAGLEGI